MPDELLQHQCLIDSNLRIAHQWPLTDRMGHTQTVSVPAYFTSNSPVAIKAMAEAGGGIGLVPSHVVDAAIADHKLQRVLPEYHSLKYGVYAIYAHR